MKGHERRRAVALVALPAYERCLAALAACRTTDEVREIRDRATAMRAYARQAKDRSLEADAFEIRSRAERRLGELLLAQKATVGFAKGGQPYQATRSGAEQVEPPAPTLAAAGIDRKLSARAQRLALLSAVEFRLVIADGRERIMSEGRERVQLHFTGDMEWYSPPELIERARAVMGSIDCDPASCALAQRVGRARTWFDAKRDGLKQRWTGNVWLNPPFSRGLIDQFVEKLLAERRNFSQAIAVVHSRTDANWFQRLGDAASAIAFPKGHIKFYNETDCRYPGIYGNAIVYVGARSDAFAGAFADCLVFVGGRKFTSKPAPLRAIVPAPIPSRARRAA